MLNSLRKLKLRAVSISKVKKKDGFLVSFERIQLNLLERKIKIVPIAKRLFIRVGKFRWKKCRSNICLK